MVAWKSLSFFVLIISFSCVWLPLWSQEIDEEHEPYYAGTQLAFYAENAAPGRLSVQPYFSATRRFGFYNQHWATPKQVHIDQGSLLLSLETGITEWLDITLDLFGAYSHFKNRHSWLFGDTTAYLGFQISRDKKHTWIPDFRILLGETFPTGKYDRLDPNKGGSDILGLGAYATSFLAVLAKTLYPVTNHPININLNLIFVAMTSAPVHGLNVYGGALDTRGKVNPGNLFIINLALEYSIDRYWALGTDIHYVHQDKSTFSGKRGILLDGSTATIGLPSSEQFSLAPCIEYSWNENFSVALGPWVTVAGRNSLNFVSIVGNVFYYF